VPLVGETVQEVTGDVNVAQLNVYDAVPVIPELVLVTVSESV
jgi:hypothetical protein